MVLETGFLVAGSALLTAVIAKVKFFIKKMVVGIAVADLWINH